MGGFFVCGVLWVAWSHSNRGWPSSAPGLRYLVGLTPAGAPGMSGAMAQLGMPCAWPSCSATRGYVCHAAQLGASSQRRRLTTWSTGPAAGLTPPLTFSLFVRPATRPRRRANPRGLAPTALPTDGRHGSPGALEGEGAVGSLGPCKFRTTMFRIWTIKPHWMEIKRWLE